MPRQLSAYDGIVDTYINALAPTHNHTFIQGPNDTFANGFEIGRVDLYGLTTFQRSCPVSVFRSALNETEAPYTYFRVCFSANDVLIKAEVTQSQNHAVSFFYDI